MPNELDEKTVKKLQKLNAILSEDAITKEEFLSAFEQVLKLVRTLKEKNLEELDGLKNAFESVKSSLTDGSKSELDNLKAQIRADIGMLSSQLEAKSKAIDQRMALIKDGLDGKDADEISIVAQVLSQIKLPENRAPIMDGPEEIRNKLELLKEEDEKLKIAAIGHLEERLDKLEKRPQGRLGSGGTSAMGVQTALRFFQVIEEEVSFSGTTGTLTHTPEADSVKLYRGGVRMQEGTGKDFTISGNTITLATAALAEEVFVADYNK